VEISFSDVGGGVTECYIFNQTSSLQGAVYPASLTSGTVSTNISEYAGTHVYRAECRDGAGNQSVPVYTTFNVLPDNNAPTATISGPTTGVINTPVSLTLGASDQESGIALCQLTEGATVHYTSGAAATMPTGISTSSSSAPITFTTTGAHVLSYSCSDAMGNQSTPAVHTVTISATATDSVAPTVGNLSTTNQYPSAGSMATYKVTASDNVGIDRCELWMNGVKAMDMNLQPSGEYWGTYTFPASTTNMQYTAKARCLDAIGNFTDSSDYFIGVTGSGNGGTNPTPTPTPTPVPTSAPSTGGQFSGNLVKLNCPEGADVNDVCRAVYYVDNNSVRHAFKNSHVFFTWYDNFDSVIEINQAEMQSMLMGKPVPYRPGAMMIKFPTVPQTYEIDRNGELRWVTDEATAIALRGSSWGQQVLDESEAYYSMYVFGAEINQTTGYNVADEELNAYPIEDAVQ